MYCVRQLFVAVTKIPNMNNLKEEGFILAQFESFRYVVGWLSGRNIMVEGYGGRKLLSSWQAERGRGQG